MPDLYDLYDLAHVAGWDPYYCLHDLLYSRTRFLSWICTIQILHKSHNGGLGLRLSRDRDLSHLSRV